MTQAEKSYHTRKYYFQLIPQKAFLHTYIKKLDGDMKYFPVQLDFSGQIASDKKDDPPSIHLLGHFIHVVDIGSLIRIGLDAFCNLCKKTKSHFLKVKSLCLSTFTELR
jgi:hypothetical protein